MNLRNEFMKLNNSAFLFGWNSLELSAILNESSNANGALNLLKKISYKLEISSERKWKK
jgi:hypothetical protein